MKKFLLALALAAYASVASAAITVVGQAFSGTDNTDAGEAIAITPPSMQFGDLIVVYLQARNSSVVTFTLDDAGGQNWKRTARQSGSPASDSHYITWCFFNGTVSGDGTFNWTYDTTSDNSSGWMVVFRGVERSAPFDVYLTDQAQASSTTWAMGSMTTLTSGAVAFFCGSSQDDNTWTIDNSFVAPVSAIYWRNTSGADSSIFFAIKTISSPGAVGSTTATQATLGADGGSDSWGALRQSGNRRGILM